MSMRCNEECNKGTSQSSITAHVAEPAEARHPDNIEIIATLFTKPEGPWHRGCKNAHSKARRGYKSSASLEILWLF